MRSGANTVGGRKADFFRPDNFRKTLCTVVTVTLLGAAVTPAEAEDVPRFKAQDCETLAHFAAAVAAARDEGRSQAEQQKITAEQIVRLRGFPGFPQTKAEERQLLDMIDVVHRSKLSPRETGEQVFGICMDAAGVEV